MRSRIKKLEKLLQVTKDNHNAILTILTDESNKAVIKLDWDDRESSIKLSDDALDAVVDRLIQIKQLRSR